MMYLSHLMIDVGNNPDRPRPGRLWLRNIYHVHQRLLMAFPTGRQRGEDPRFLRPFDPAGFERPRFLFRIDNSIEDNCPRTIILVQSNLQPNWDYAFQNARMFLAAEPEFREWQPAFPAGNELRFRILINLSKKTTESKNGTDLRKLREGTDTLGRPKSQGKRVALTWEDGQKPEEAIVPWFARKAAQSGFELRDCHVLRLGWAAGYLPEKKAPRKEGEEGAAGHPARQMRFRSALLEGTLAVADAPLFAQAIASGIGSAKAFGFGLLSVAPA
jgi:CRISPR system Cascade subunit CasE